VRCVIKDNGGAAVAGRDDCAALEFADCVIAGNGDDRLPRASGFPEPPPQASFDAPATVKAGELVRFASTSRASRGRITSVLWDFGDGCPAELTPIRHTYGRPGVYRVTLVVWDSQGRGARAERQVRVTRD